MKKFIVTVTPPTPNGDLHLGHLSGPFLAADVMHRQLKQAGHDVLFVTYSDDYQSYLPRKTQTLLREPFDYARLMRQAMMLSLELVNIRFDHFMQAAENPFYQRAGEYYAALIANQIELKPYKTFHCAVCNTWGYEGFGRTNCNWCGTSSDTSQCEHCARMPDVNQISEMTCMSCQGAMQPVSVKQHIWKIGQNYPAVKSALAKRPARSCLTDYLAHALNNEDEQWPLSRPGDAGLAVSALDNYPLHTWFLGLAGYKSSVESYLDAHPERGGLEEWWTPETELVHFLGFDCSYSHAIGYSSLLLADKNGPRPGTFITNRFLKLDGEDFSTSRGHAVWIKDLTGQYPADAIRLFSALFAPETEVADFNRHAFHQWCSQVFLPLVHQLKLAQSSGVSLSAEQQYQLRHHPACQAWRQSAALVAFSITGMARAMMELAEFIRADETLQQAPEAWQILAELAQPLCPDLAEIALAQHYYSGHATEVAHESV
ncbi:methionine--tRNA ligase [Salmonella enterica subsp. enterica]|nr:methionine--tRNA ligase [Salmonella enterica]EBQ9479966.1 methionine--tRNA ligase [Salmonella enterica subsp. enterica serovar Kokomlemle]ECS5198539.1 methionine--tRNA ligase [Salmonella enterica subsp. enterica serovar Poano]EBJ7122031.1 methionine--tRNA ligase [Salmonella enterica]ECX4750922.1 methionine--tRNA ligase [Salmonella enterica]